MPHFVLDEMCNNAWRQLSPTCQVKAVVCVLLCMVAIVAGLAKGQGQLCVCVCVHVCVGGYFF